MEKKLKIWNGRGHGKYCKHHFYVAAYSIREAVDLINKHSKSCITPSEIKNYYSPCWGDPMDGIDAKTPCLYATLHYNNPFLIFKEPAYPSKAKPKH